jgi:hypothetical protein
MLNQKARYLLFIISLKKGKTKWSPAIWSISYLFIMLETDPLRKFKEATTQWTSKPFDSSLPKLEMAILICSSLVWYNLLNKEIFLDKESMVDVSMLLEKQCLKHKLFSVRITTVFQRLLYLNYLEGQMNLLLL